MAIPCRSKRYSKINNKLYLRPGRRLSGFRLKRMEREKRSEVFKDTSAMAACWLTERFNNRLGFNDTETKGELDKGGDFFQRNRCPWSEEAVVADFHKTCRQDML